MTKRPISKVAPDWWDYTTLDPELLADAAKLSADDLLQLSGPGFTVTFHDTLEEFYLAEALEYINAWRQATPDNPAGICGPIGPTEQLPLVARLVNALELDLRRRAFLGHGRMGRRTAGKPVAHRSSAELRQGRHGDVLQPHRSKSSRCRRRTSTSPPAISRRTASRYDEVRCVVMQGRARRSEALGVQRPAPSRVASTRTRRRRRRSIASSPRASPICTR